MMVMRADPPGVVDVGLAAVLDRDDVIDLEELNVRAALDAAGRVTGLERPAQLGWDRAFR
jgi:hypothetical protein